MPERRQNLARMNRARLHTLSPELTAARKKKILLSFHRNICFRRSAARELLEETGAVAEELIELGMFLPACAYSDEAIHMYAAKKLTFREQKLDADEFLNVFTMPLEQAVQKVLAGEIWDAKTQTALLKVWLLRQQGRL